MAHSGSRPDQRAELSPPRDPSSRVKRSGYVLLAASGVVLATAFGGIAQLASPSSTSASGDIKAGNANSSASPELIPGNAVPGTMTVSGAAQADPSTSPTAVVSVGPDGTPVVTLVPAPGSNQRPIVLPPGAPIPPGTIIPPGTTIPSTNPTTPSDPGKSDPGPTTTKPTSTPPPTSNSTTPPATSTHPSSPPSSSTTPAAPTSSSSGGTTSGSTTSGGNG